MLGNELQSLKNFALPINFHWWVFVCLKILGKKKSPISRESELEDHLTIE